MRARTGEKMIYRKKIIMMQRFSGKFKQESSDEKH